MKKIINIAIIAIMVFSLSSCSALMYALEEMAESESTDTAEIELIESNKKTELTSNMPTLPDLDFASMDLLDDGYAIAEYRTNPDGDTATFIVDGTPFVTRFLAIDTPEMHYEENNPEPYAEEALQFTENALKNAHTIILETDKQSDIFDDYDRLLAWIWVDGELLNYQLVSEGLAYVKYLYGDYKYNNDLLEIESQAEANGIRLWGGNIPSYTESETSSSNTDNSQADTIAEARNRGNNASIEISGVVTNTIGNNAFIQDETGGIYVYANNKHYDELQIGSYIQVSGRLTEYKGLLELTDIGDKIITVLGTNQSIEPAAISLNDLSESLESQYVRVNYLTIEDIITSSEKGYNIIVSDGNTRGTIRIDRYLSPYPDPSFVSVGDSIDVIGNVAQHESSYQIMIGSADDVIIK